MGQRGIAPAHPLEVVPLDVLPDRMLGMVIREGGGAGRRRLGKAPCYGCCRTHEVNFSVEGYDAVRGWVQPCSGSEIDSQPESAKEAARRGIEPLESRRQILTAGELVAQLSGHLEWSCL